MDSFEISEDVRVFLREHVETYEKLEVILLLAGQRDERWTTEAMAGRLNLTAESAEEALDGLRASGLVEVVEEGGRSFRYRPESARLRETVERLVRAHESQRLDIIRLMSANAIDRIRNAAIHTFADSFVLRRSKKDG